METLSPTQASDAIKQEFDTIADRYPDDLNTWTIMLTGRAKRIAEVLDQKQMNECIFNYATVDLINIDTDSPSVWNPIETDIHDAVARVLNPVANNEPICDESRPGIRSTYTTYKTAVPNISLTAVEIQNRNKHETKTYWSVLKASALNE